MVKFIKLMRSVILVIALVATLKFTGLLGAISYYSQTALLTSGLLNARVEIKERKPFPFDFEIQTMEGKRQLMQDLKGKVIFLNLWATWCGPCRAEMPSINKLYTSQKDSIVFIMLSLDKSGHEAKIKKFVTDNEFTFSVYRPAGSLPEMLRVPSIPVTFVIDKSGNIVYEHTGAANYNTNRFRKFLNSLLKK